MKNSLKYGLKVSGWFLLYLIGTELFMRVFVVSLFPFEILKQGNIFEVWGIEGYGVTRYLPYAEVKTPYDSGEYSVAVLGNSYTMSKQVMDWESYVSVAEADLRARGVSADLHNLGINGLTLPSYIARSAFVLEQYNPDVVVIQVSPNEFFSLGFQEHMRGGYFAYTETNEVELVLTNSEDLLLPEQIQSSAPSMNVWEYSSIGAYLSYNARAEAEGRRPDVDRQKIPNDELVTQQLQLLANAYGDVPIVFVMIPHDLVANRKGSKYEDGERYGLVMDIIARDHPTWQVVYPVKEFNQILNKGLAPMGFNNTKPFYGHMNVNGHRIVGTVLAEVLAGLLK